MESTMKSRCVMEEGERGKKEDGRWMEVREMRLTKEARSEGRGGGGIGCGICRCFHSIFRLI